MVAIRVEVHPGFPSVEVIVRCPSETAEVTSILAAIRGVDSRFAGLKDGMTHVIEWPDVLYCESVDKRCFIYTAGAVYESQARLYEIEDRFGDVGFVRISKSQVVNIRQISALRPEFSRRLVLVMANGERLIANRNYARSLKERLGLT